MEYFIKRIMFMWILCIIMCSQEYWCIIWLLSFILFLFCLKNICGLSINQKSIGTAYSMSSLTRFCIIALIDIEMYSPLIWASRAWNIKYLLSQHCLRKFIILHRQYYLSWLPFIKVYVSFVLRMFCHVVNFILYFIM